MHKRSLFLTILGVILILLSGCTSVPSKQQTPAPQAVTLLEPAVPVSATCAPTPVHAEQHDGGLAIPWIAATPITSGIIGYLFFTPHVTPTDKPEYYQPMHTGGKMPGGGTTKILWMVQNPSASGELIVSGKNLSHPGGTFQQTFPEAGGGIPSIIDVPTAGCWHFDLQSGSDHATAIFWVVP